MSNVPGHTKKLGTWLVNWSMASWLSSWLHCWQRVCVSRRIQTLHIWLSLWSHRWGWCHRNWCHRNCMGGIPGSAPDVRQDVRSNEIWQTSSLNIVSATVSAAAGPLWVAELESSSDAEFVRWVLCGYLYYWVSGIPGICIGVDWDWRSCLVSSPGLNISPMDTVIKHCTLFTLFTSCFPASSVPRTKVKEKFPNPHPEPTPSWSRKLFYWQPPGCIYYKV